jgi:hypothetical protein
VRRDRLSALGIELPLLPTVALGGLPGGAGWAARLERIGLDVVASGGAPDTPETWRAARAAAPHRPVKAVAGDVEALVAAGCRLVEAVGPLPDGAYALGPDEAMVALVDGGSPEIEDPAVVGRLLVEAARAGDPSRLWVVATPGLERLAPDVVEAKLEALVESAVQARLVLAKEQFDR